MNKYTADLLLLYFQSFLTRGNLFHSSLHRHILQYARAYYAFCVINEQFAYIWWWQSTTVPTHMFKKKEKKETATRLWTMCLDLNIGLWKALIRICASLMSVCANQLLTISKSNRLFKTVDIYYTHTHTQCNNNRMNSEKKQRSEKKDRRKKQESYIAIFVTN